MAENTSFEGHAAECWRGYSCICSKKKLSDMESAALVAKERGCIIIHPNANELFIDIDTPEQMATFTKRILYFMPNQFRINPSPSGKENHFHITVKLSFNVGRVMRIFLQWFLGSDPKREKLSLYRLIRWGGNPTIFFELVPDSGIPFR